MNGMVQQKHGAAEVMDLQDIQKPEIHDHDVLVRVRAAGVKPANWVSITVLGAQAVPGASMAAAS